MAFDRDLAERIRELLAGAPDVTEQRMFGGLAFLINGNMAVAASGQGGLLVRVAPEDTDTYVDDERVRPMVMRGREMRGWLHIDPAATRTTNEVDQWVTRGAAYVRSLPAKSPGRRRRSRSTG
ncbi:TfoX/Sxy family protein [Amycolatopsis pithecellobii]|uniref:RNA methyltransferase n=1 Tax=Amycolatopsis pithecellobii TaxID=664692 RepID=A0A6N7YNH7_9PSEU|nr:TfoX/Sxy family protein [Amycolatopsis pithecellobii]MTD54557.1 RNA methyltransferase [Amycolatopsis pithecellobii]